MTLDVPRQNLIKPEFLIIFNYDEYGNEEMKKHEEYLSYSRKGGDEGASKCVLL